MRLIPVVTASLLLAACAADSGGSDRNSLAASACDAAAKAQLDGKSYELDTETLAASLKEVGDGTQFLKAPLVVEPGLATEAKQVLECTVRFSEGKPTPDVISVVFNW
ncbi:MAG TPA: hypothetical protein VFY12_09915 [Arenimonas sp.]|nr:hypothetical protein [Arenimonas sp.]